MATFASKNIPCIEINGHSFALRMSEADMLEQNEQLKNMCNEFVAAKPEERTQKDVLRICRACEQFINDLCGENALSTMMGGVPLGVLDTARLTGVVKEEADRAFNAALVEKHA